MKAIVAGAVVALTSGLLMGAALKPDLGTLDRPEGPQMMAWNGVRSTGPFDDGATLASYNGKIPDYVLGTDYKKATQIYPTAEAPAPIEVAATDDPPPDVPLTRASYDDEDPPPPPPSYPSIDGGAPDGADVPAQTQSQNLQPDDPTAG